MALDGYSPCPCGSGKKIKFCCPREHINDYLKVFELIDAEQFAAASELTDRLVAKAPQQICFLALQATFLDPADEAASRQMAERLQAVAPEHPTTKAAQAVVALHDQNIPQAIDFIQDGIERLESAVPTLLLTAIGSLAELAYNSGDVTTALAHGHYVMTLTKGRHSATGSLLRDIMNQFAIPLSIKDDWPGRLQMVFADQMDARIAALTARGKWRRARAEGLAWSQRHPENPCALGMLAVLHGNLGEPDAAAQYWTKLAEHPDVPEQIAADAFINAQFLAQNDNTSHLSLVQCTIPLTDLDGLMEKLLSNRRAVSSKRDLTELADEESPPPKALFHVLDRDPVEFQPDMSVDQFPLVMFDLFIFGKQTDRPARAELTIARDPERDLLAAAKALLEGHIDGEIQEEEIGRAPAVMIRLNKKRYISDSVPLEHALRLDRQELDLSIEKTWLEQPHPLLQGRSPLEAAGQPQLRRRLLAAILSLESMPPFDMWTGDYQALWNRLGLTRDIPVKSLSEISMYGLNHLLRLDVSALGDGELAGLTQLAASHGARQAARRFAKLLTERPTARKEFDLTEVYGFLKMVANDPEDKLAWSKAAVEWCREVGKPEGPLLVEQMVILMTMGRSNEAKELMQHIMTHHRSDTETMRELFEVLSSLGLIGPDGRMRQMPPAAAAAEEPSAGRIWTPDQAQHAEGKAPSKLWVPGMD